MKHFLKQACLAAAVTATFISCKKNELPLAPALVFKLDKFEQNILDSLKGKTTGFTYSISRDGKQVRSGAGGYAVATWDIAGGVLHSPDKRQDIASCSKTITALTLMSIMQEKGRTIQDSLFRFLPGTWITNVSQSFRAATFEDVMRHETGFPAGQIDYFSLKNFAQTPGSYPNGSYDYQNQNYAFLRIAIAYMAHPVQMKALEPATAAGPSDNRLDSAINSFYIQEVNARVFAPSGIPYSLPTPAVETNPTMNYNFSTQDPGWNKGDMTRFAGSAGWRLSARQQNEILANLKYTDKILNNTWKDLMNQRLLGWERGWSSSVTGGTMYMHGGYFEDKFSPNQSSAPKGRGCYTVHVLFPNNYECAIQVNSLGGTPNMNNVAKSCYEGAWVTP
jgi:hypothetical protein